ncbi:MAG: hypothetical protein AAF483_01880 [Planctomycetota bacterium]
MKSEKFEPDVFDLNRQAAYRLNNLLLELSLALEEHSVNVEAALELDESDWGKRFTALVSSPSFFELLGELSGAHGDSYAVDFQRRLFATEDAIRKKLLDRSRDLPVVSNCLATQAGLRDSYRFLRLLIGQIRSAFDLHSRAEVSQTEDFRDDQQPLDVELKGSDVAQDEESSSLRSKLESTLTENDRFILVAMLNLKAFATKPETGRSVVEAALFRGDVKRAFRNLVANKLVDSKKGKSGGYWLTETGAALAAELKSIGATN